jgi:hypothetical protein
MAIPSPRTFAPSTTNSTVMTVLLFATSQSFITVKLPSAFGLRPEHQVQQYRRGDGQRSDRHEDGQGGDLLAGRQATAPATVRPEIHPNRKPSLFAVALAVKSVKMTAMIGTGLIATPIAFPRKSPMTERKSTPTDSAWARSAQISATYLGGRCAIRLRRGDDRRQMTPAARLVLPRVGQQPVPLPRAAIP